MTTAVERALAREWFYEFELPDGRRTRSYLPDDVATIHTTRLEMIDRVLTPEIGHAWSDASCIDVACHEGFFAVHLAKRGCRTVVGVDIRPENLEGATLMREVYNLPNLQFQLGDVMSLETPASGPFDIVLMLGLLYHLENPVGALRVARTLTKRVCLVETQVTPNLTGITDWGSHQFSKAIVGAFSVVDETVEVQELNREANVGYVSLVPSLEALLHVMRAVGFGRAVVVVPPAVGNEQLTSGKRVLVAGYPS